MKESMFNYVHEGEYGDLYLYNSFQGTKSLIYVSPQKASKIQKILKSEYFDIDDDDCSMLLRNGYIINDDVDEEQLKEYKYFQVVSDSRLNITILPTEKCNFRCVYCYETFEKPQMSIDTQDAFIHFVEKNIHQYTGLSVHWFGGEPLIAMEVIENISLKLIEICKKVKKTFMASMTTNGYLLNLDMLKRLAKLHVYRYQITIDGIEKTHNYQRPLLNGNPSFQTIINNLTDIRLHKGNRYIQITIRTNMSKSIFDHLDEYIEVLHDICQDDPRFSLYLHQVSDWGGERITEMQEDLIECDMYERTLKKLKDSPYKFNYYAHYGRLDSEACICYANKLNYIIVGADGILYKCSGNFEVDCNKIGKLCNDGTLCRDKNKEALWVCNIRRVREQCKECYFSGNCLSGICPAVQIRGFENDFCSFEKQYLGLFLELFNKSVYQIIE